MLFIDRATGECRHADDAPATDWIPIRGRGVLVRRREPTGFNAAHVFEPDIPLWTAQGWERVRFVSTLPARRAVRGARSGLKIEIADRDTRELALHDAPEPTARTRRKPPAAAGRIDRGSVWVILPEEPGRDTPMARPGAQAIFTLAELRAGAAAANIAANLLLGRIVTAGIPLDRAMWVLTGPPVSPEDSSIVRKLRPVIALAERLSEDLRTAIRGYVPGTADDGLGTQPRVGSTTSKGGERAPES